MDWSKFSQYGLEGLVICALFFVLYKMINYTMKFIDKTTEQQSQERLAWQVQQRGMTDAIKELNESIKLQNQQTIASHEALKEANGYQRAEHEKMIGILNEQTLALGRINGYKTGHGNS